MCGRRDNAGRGRSTVDMTNQNGVRVRIISTNRGIDVTLARPEST